MLPRLPVVSRTGQHRSLGLGQLGGLQAESIDGHNKRCKEVSRQCRCRRALQAAARGHHGVCLTPKSPGWRGICETP